MSNEESGSGAINLNPTQGEKLERFIGRLTRVKLALANENSKSKPRQDIVKSYNDEIGKIETELNAIKNEINQAIS